MSSFSVSPKPRVILGLMNHGPPGYNDSRVTSVADLERHLDRFQTTYGYNEIDTARIYAQGKQERFTAEAGWKSRGLHVATKSWPVTQGYLTAANVRKDLETSLSELGTDLVDIFYIHAADRAVPITETLEAADTLYKEGKFKRLGISNFSAYEVAEIVMLCHSRGWIKPTIYQGLYNAVARNLETEIIPACHRYGLDVVVYSPLAGGLLSGRFKGSLDDNTKAEANGRYSLDTWLGPIFRDLYFKENTFKALEIIRSAAEKHGFSVPEVALRWAVHHSALRTASKGGNDGFVLGISKIEQLDQNISDLAKGPLPEDVVEALEKAWLITKGTAPLPWIEPLEYTYDAKEVLFKD